MIISLLPVTFLRTLRRPFHERVLIGCLMAAGMAATGIAVARLVRIMGYLGKGGPRVNVEQDILWGLELTIGVLTASIPTLKAPVHRLLLSWGVLRSNAASDLSSESFLDHMPNGSHVTRQMRQWDEVVRELAPGIQAETGNGVGKGPGWGAGKPGASLS